MRLMLALLVALCGTTFAKDIAIDWRAGTTFPPINAAQGDAVVFTFRLRTLDDVFLSTGGCDLAGATRLAGPGDSPFRFVLSKEAGVTYTFVSATPGHCASGQVRGAAGTQSGHPLTPCLQRLHVRISSG